MAETLEFDGDGRMQHLDQPREQYSFYQFAPGPAYFVGAWFRAYEARCRGAGCVLVFDIAPTDAVTLCALAYTRMADGKLCHYSLDEHTLSIYCADLKFREFCADVFGRIAEHRGWDNWIVTVVQGPQTPWEVEL